MPKLCSYIRPHLPSHSFLRLSKNGKPEYEIHGDPQRMRDGDLESPESDNSIPMIMDALGLKQSVWYRLVANIQAGEDCTPENKVSASLMLYDGEEEDVLPHWNAALSCAMDINNNHIRYNLLLKNCNTATAALCRAAGIDIVKTETHTIGFHKKITEIQDGFLRHFSFQSSPELQNLREMQENLTKRIIETGNKSLDKTRLNVHPA